MDIPDEQIRRSAAELRGHADDIAERLEEAQAKVAPLQSALLALQQEEATGNAADGEVRVTLDATGRVKAVYISPRAQRDLDGAGIGAAVLEAVKEAQRVASERVSEVLQESAGVTIPDVESVEQPSGDPYAEVRRAIDEFPSVQIDR